MKAAMRTPTRKIQLTQGYVAIIDAADADLISHYKWRAQVAGNKVYAVTAGGNRRKALYMHRLLSGAHPGCNVRFKNSNSLDNRRKNLFATPPPIPQGGGQ